MHLILHTRRQEQIRRISAIMLLAVLLSACSSAEKAPATEVQTAAASAEERSNTESSAAPAASAGTTEETESQEEQTDIPEQADIPEQTDIPASTEIPESAWQDSVQSNIQVSVQSAKTVQLLPDVTAEMTSPEFWCRDDAGADEVLADLQAVRDLNQKTLKTKGCNMNDLRNASGTVGTGMADSLYHSARSDFQDYLHGNFFDEYDLPVSEDMMERVTSNVKNPEDNAEHPALYGIAVHRTYLRQFPTDDIITDDKGDINFDYIAVSSIRVNEPVVIWARSADEKYLYGMTSNCEGWIPAEDIAICSSKEEWLDAWDFPAEKTLVVTECRIYLDESNTDEDVSELMLTMGTWLEKAEETDGSELITDRSVQYNYTAYVPLRGEDGSYHKKVALIPLHYDLSDGYVPLTRRNILTTAFGALGEAYGWGGMLATEDCSGYIRSVYRCFGLELPRNSSWQSRAPVKSWDLKGLSPEEKEKVLDDVPAGSTLFFEGHEMMYLGKANDKYYVVSAVSSAESPYDSDRRKMRIRSVAINSLDMHRPDDTTWLSNLTKAVVPCLMASD